MKVKCPLTATERAPGSGLNCRKEVAREGVEPPTRGFSVRCSTT